MQAIPPCTLSVDLVHDPRNIEFEKIFAICPDVFDDNGVKKLSHTLFPKKNYIAHHRALKKYIDYGMIVTNVNKVIFFDEEAWIRGYIEYCVENRRIAKKDGIESLVQFWKDMMNSVYGKTMEDVRNRVDFRLVNDRDTLSKLIKCPSYQDEIIYVNNSSDDFLVGVNMLRPKILLNKPIYTGQCILDNSKILMYKFIYDYCMKVWPGGKFKVCQTDTDSIIAEITTDDIIFDIKDDIHEWFDTSSLLRTEFDGTIVPKVNRTELGKLKDELGGQFMTEFVGVGPKNYSYSYMKLDGTESNTSVCKGIPKCSHPEFHVYKKLIIHGKDDETVNRECARITSKSHSVKTGVTEKIALKKELRKRVRCENDEFETVPYDYYELIKEND